MDAYRLTVVLHWLLAVVIAGQALFWFIMRAALQQQHAPTEAAALLQAAATARWPHVAVPWSMRLPLPWVAWVTIAAAVASGWLLNLQWRELSSAALASKLALLALLVVAQIQLTRRVASWAIVTNLCAALALVIVSAWIVR